MSGVRMELVTVARPQFEAMAGLERSISLDDSLGELIKLRASQINGCAYCIDMHWKDARARGEGEERLYSLDAWRESPLYSDRERAALGLCEAMTLISGSPVPDDVWDAAARVFDDKELAQLVFAISAINAWNRLMVTVRTPPGTYRPSASGAST